MSTNVSEIIDINHPQGVEPERPTEDGGPFGYFNLTLSQLFREGERITGEIIAIKKELATDTNMPALHKVRKLTLEEYQARAEAIRQAIPRKVGRWRHKMSEYDAEAGRQQATAARLRAFWKIDEHDDEARKCEAEISRMETRLQWLCEEFGWQEIDIDETTKLVIKQHHDPSCKWIDKPGPTHFRDLGESYVQRTKPTYQFIAKTIKPLIIANEAARAAGKELPHPEFDGLATLEYKRTMKFDIKTTRKK